MARRRMQLGRALSALRNLVADPDDTAQVFAIVEALGAPALRRNTQRMARHPEGARVLERRPTLAALLSDWNALEAMPEGSLGREYLAFCQREGIRAEGLAAANEQGSYRGLTEDETEQFVGNRLRDMHDLWHVVGGYHADLVGEAGVLAMTVPQTKNPGIALIVLVAFLLNGPTGGRGVIVDGFKRGLRCAWLPAQPWEELLELPLSQVRVQLRLEAPPRYRPIYKRDVRDLLLRRLG